MNQTQAGTSKIDVEIAIERRPLGLVPKTSKNHEYKVKAAKTR